MKMHKLRKHSNEKPSKCALCDMKFKTKYELKRHERIHTNEGAYSCSQNDQKFDKLSHMKSHENTHINDEFDKIQEKKFNLKKTEIKLTRVLTSSYFKAFHLPNKS